MPRNLEKKRPVTTYEEQDGSLVRDSTIAPSDNQMALNALNARLHTFTDGVTTHSKSAVLPEKLRTPLRAAGPAAL